MTLEYLSVSQLQMFDPRTYGGCNRKWWFAYVKKIRAPSTKAQDAGKQGHKQIEDYLKTGDASHLGPVAAAGRRFLPTPKVYLDLELPIHGDALRTPLTLDGVPFRGYIDALSTDETFRDDAGTLHDDPDCAEVLDWKFVSSLEYAKTAEDLRTSIQMNGYGRWALENLEPRRIRLSQGFFATRGAHRASKVSVVVTPAEVRGRWDDLVPLARKIRETSGAERVSDVEPTWNSCDAYRGCYYRMRCPRAPKESVMGLLDDSDEPEMVKEIAKLEAQLVNPPDAPKSEPPHSAAPLGPEDRHDLPPSVLEASKAWDAPAAESSEPPKTAAKKRGRPPKSAAPPLLTPTKASETARCIEESVFKQLAAGEKVPYSESTKELQLFVGRANVPTRDLDEYIRAKCAELEAEYGAADIRCAPMDSPLAYTKWKGVLAAAVRLDPPDATTPWCVENVAESEIRQVVVEALKPLCGLFVRGGL